MAPAGQPRFDFAIKGLPKDTFSVVSLTGKEGLSKLYEFDVLLASKQQSVDKDAVRSGAATLSLRRPGKPDLAWRGMVAVFEQMECNHGYCFYRAALVPRAWRLTRIFTTRIFLDTDLRHILETTLKQGGLTPGQDFELRLNIDYPKREWVCQYEETSFNFISRHMERAGLYFYFEQGDSGEKLIITDSSATHEPMAAESGLDYRPASGLDEYESFGSARTFRQIIRQQPGNVTIRGYNYRTVAHLEDSHAVDEQGMGEVYRHSEDPRSGAEARHMAKVSAEAFQCRAEQYRGETDAPFLRPGYEFSLHGHFNKDMDRQYLTLEVSHEAHQESYIASSAAHPGQERPFYRNTVLAIPSGTQYRPETATPRPVVGGPVTGWIDAEGSGKYAEVDSLGRYKVRFPFDLSGRKDGKASHWIRMLTPYGGEGHGLHLPLHKDTEVLVAFIGGNPDRPVIAGAVPNQRQKMTVTESNSTQARLTTAGGNLIHIEDMEGSQRVLISSPTQGTYMRIGAPNDPEHDGSGSQSPADGKDKDKDKDKGKDKDKDKDKGGESGGEGEGKGHAFSEEGYKIYTNGWFTLKAQESMEMILGNKNEVIVGLETATVLGGKTEMILGVGLFEAVWPWQKVFTPESTEIKAQFTELNESVEHLTGTLNANVGDLTEFIIARTAAVSSEVETVADRVHTVETDVQNHGQRIHNAETSIQNAGTRMDNIEQHTQTIAQRTQNIAQLENTVGTLNNQVAEMSNTVDELTDIVLARTHTGDTYVMLLQTVEMTSVEVTIM